MVTGERGIGGRWKRRVFARLVWQGMDPYDAFLKADYEVRGVNSKVGYSIQQAQNRAAAMASSDWCRELIFSWTMPAKEQVSAAVPEAIGLLVQGLSDRTKEGNISSLAVRCAENLLDRGGVVRSQKLETSETPDQGTRDAKELIGLIKRRLEELEGPVRRPASINRLRGSDVE